jgi:RNA polymerase sigma factor (sigma-70 family)
MNFLKNTETNFEDAALLKKFKETGDKNMLASLFGRYMEMVFGVCLKYLEDREDAKDAVMNIYEELEKKALKHEVDNFKSWLYVLSKNHCLMHLRSKKNVKSVALNPAFMHSEEETHLNGVFEKEETMMKMEGCIKTLNSEQQQCIVAFYLQEKSYQEIAAETTMDWNKVRSLIQNGRRNLKICMEK